MRACLLRDGEQDGVEVAVEPGGARLLLLTLPAAGKISEHGEDVMFPLKLIQWCCRPREALAWDDA